MNSREIVKAALNHEETTRVPVDFGGHRSSGITAMAYSRLKKALGIGSGHIYVYDMVQQLAIVEPPVLDALGVDVVEMGRGFLLEDGDWKDWVLPNGEVCKIPYYINVKKRGEDWYIFSSDGCELGVQKKGCIFFEQTHFPLLERPIGKDDFSDLEEKIGHTIWAGVPHPGAHIPLTEEGLAEMGAAARKLRETTDRAILGLFGGNLFELSQWLYRMDNFLLAMAAHEDAVLRLTEKICHIHMANLEKWLAAVGPYIEVIVFGDDLGGQNGPLISPEMYGTFYKPFHKRLFSRAKELANVKVMLHSCGSIRAFLPDLIDAGLDAVNPVQISAIDMKADALKKDFGGEITLWGGGCDTRSLLRGGTPESIARHVKEQVHTLKPGGGFVFQQVHNILDDVPTENILAMLEALAQ